MSGLHGKSFSRFFNKIRVCGIGTPYTPVREDTQGKHVLSKIYLFVCPYVTELCFLWFYIDRAMVRACYVSSTETCVTLVNVSPMTVVTSYLTLERSRGYYTHSAPLQVHKFIGAAKDMNR